MSDIENHAVGSKGTTKKATEDSVVTSGEKRSEAKKGSAKWTDVLRVHFISVLVDRTNSGVFTDSGFKAQDWKWITAEFTGRTGKQFDKSQLQSQCAELKKKYSIVAALKDNSGFGWDHDNNLPTAPNDVWDRYIAAHPKAAPFRTQALVQFNELDVIFNGKSATGEFAMSSMNTTQFTPVANSETEDYTPDDSFGSSTGDAGSNDDYLVADITYAQGTPIRQMVHLNLADDDQDDTDDTAEPNPNRKRSGQHQKKVKPPKIPRSNSKSQAIHALTTIANRKSRIQLALELFTGSNDSKGLSVTHRLHVKGVLSSSVNTAELYLSCDEEERTHYVNELLAALISD